MQNEKEINLTNNAVKVKPTKSEEETIEEILVACGLESIKKK